MSPRSTAISEPPQGLAALRGIGCEPSHLDLARSPNRRKALRRFGELSVNIHTSPLQRQRPRGEAAARRWNGRTLTLHNANGREGRGARWNGRTQTLQRPNGRGAGGRAGMGVRKLCTALVCTPSGSLSWRNAADVLARSLPRRHMSCPLVSATFRMRSPSDGWSRTTTLAAILAAVLHVVPAGRG